MATGDITGQSISANGAQIVFDIEGLDSSTISGIESGKSATLDCTSEGFTGTSLGTKNRTGIATKFSSASPAASGIEDHTPDTNTPGGSWVAIKGNASTTGDNNLKPDSFDGSGDCVILIDSDVYDDFHVRADVTHADVNASCSVVALSNSDGSEFLVADFDDAVNMIRLRKFEGGVFTTLATVASGVGATENHEIEVSGSTVYVKENDGITIRITHSLSTGDQTTFLNASHTYVGVYFNDTGSRIDDFLVQTNIVSPTTIISDTFTSSDDATITLDLAEPIHNDDVSVTLSVDVAAFSDGVNTSNVLSAGVVTNNSALDYPVAACGIVGIVENSVVEVFPRITSGAFYVDVVAFGPVYGAYEPQAGIAAVQVTVTEDAATPGDAVSKTATQMQLIDRVGTGGVAEQWAAFRVGPFDITASGDWGVGGADNGVATIEVTAYPKVGDADSVRTSGQKLWAYFDKSDVLDTHVCYVDASLGNDLTAEVDNPVLPAATLGKAAALCQATSSSGQASFSEAIIVSDGNYNWGGTASVETNNGPFKVKRGGSATKSGVVVNSTSSDGLRTNWTQADDITISVAPSQSANPTTNSNATLYGATDFCGVVFKDVDFSGSGRENSETIGYGPTYDFSAMLGCSLSDAKTAQVSPFSRDITIERVANDVYAGVSNQVACNVRVDDFDRDVHTELHTDFMQIAASQNKTNLIFYVMELVNIASSVNAIFFCNGGASGTSITSMALVNIIIDDHADYPVELDDVTIDSMFVYHTTQSSWRFRQNDSTTSIQNLFAFNNIFEEARTIEGTSVYQCSISNNHFISTNDWGGFDGTSGDSFSGLMSGYDTDSFYPTNSTLSSRSVVAIVSFDTYGNEVPNDGTGAIGALQIYISTGGPGLLNSPFRF